MSFRECQLFIIALALWRQEMKDPVDLPRHIILHSHTDLLIVFLCRNQICRQTAGLVGAYLENLNKIWPEVMQRYFCGKYCLFELTCVLILNCHSSSSISV